MNAKAESMRTYRRLLRRQALVLLSGEVPRCRSCGCDDIRLLEINHINGGGRKEKMLCGETGREVLYRKIINGTRTKTDLEVLCKPCNGLDYLERLYGKLPMRIVWSPLL